MESIGVDAMPSFVPDDDAPIFVEFDAQTDCDRDPAPSAAAVNHAMNTMRSMAKMVADTMNSMSDDRPSQVEVSFGLQLSGNGQSAIVNIGRSAALSVKLTWTPKADTESAIELYRQRDRLWEELQNEVGAAPRAQDWPFPREVVDPRADWSGQPRYYIDPESGRYIKEDYEENAIWEIGTNEQPVADDEWDEEEEYDYDDYDDYDEPPPNRRSSQDDWS
jgi:hypothetical protein